MKWTVLLLLQVTVLVFGQPEERVEDGGGEDIDVPPKVDHGFYRCKRMPICEPPCFPSNDKVTNCPTCNCSAKVEEIHSEEPAPMEPNQPFEPEEPMEPKEPELPKGLEAALIPLLPCAVPMCAIPPCANGLKKNSAGCEICECAEETKAEPEYECPLRKCVACEYGYEHDEHGCQTCTCLAHPCQSHDCGADHLECRAKKTECELDMCQMVPDCGLKSLCHRRREEHQRHQGEHHGRPHHHGRDGGAEGMFGHGIMGRMGHGTQRIARAIARLVDEPCMPTCTENGDFEPRQCHHMRKECWCVDDRGQEVDGTRTKWDTEEEKPLCAKNQTKSVHGKFQMNHDINDVEQHLDNIKQATHQQLSQWLYIQKEFIVQIEVNPVTNEVNILEVEFVIITDQDGNVDLATAMYHFHLEVEQEAYQINYQGHTLTPKPNTVKVQHSFEPQLPTNKGLREKEHFYYKHKTVILAGLLGCCFLLLILIVLVKMVAAKRRSDFRHQRMQTYKENLAFSNEIYGQLGGEKPRLEFVDIDDEKKEATDSTA